VRPAGVCSGGLVARIASSSRWSGSPRSHARPHEPADENARPVPIIFAQIILSQLCKPPLCAQSPWSALLCQCSWYVWREWIWNHFPFGWRYNQIHVFHLNGAKQHLVSQDDGTAKTAAISEYDLHWTDIRDNVPLAIRCGHFSLVNLL